jgi:DNA/RNA endonuclease G (NUC1)
MNKMFLLLVLFIGMNSYGQTVITDNKLIIPHGDITLYLTKDTCALVSKHVLKFSSFVKLDKERDNKWFQDTYKGKYTKDSYLKTGYDIGHLTPSHITSYDNDLNHQSFSLFNAAPQLAGFNRGVWAQMESGVEDILAKHKKDAVIITGVIYNPKNTKFMGKSRIPIPISFFKVLFINNTTQCWIGSNLNGLIVSITLKDLNNLFVLNKMNLNIK